MPGKFIVIEGLEGAGKSTAIDIVKRQIQTAGIKLETCREPGGTPMAEAIRNCVKQDWQENVTIEAELFLMYAARAQLLQNFIQPHLADSSWVLGDRHDLSSRAYQGGGRQIPDSLIEPIREITLKGFKPDITLYLDVEPEEGLKRARGRGELDRIERAGLDFFKRTRERYLEIASSDDTIKVINTMQDMQSVHKDIETQVEQFLEHV